MWDILLFYSVFRGRDVIFVVFEYIQLFDYMATILSNRHDD